MQGDLIGPHSAWSVLINISTNGEDGDANGHGKVDNLHWTRCA